VVLRAVGSQSAVVAGGRYDGLVEALGGASIAGSGFAIGLERLALALQSGKGKANTAPDVAIVALGDTAVAHANRVAAELRAQDLRTEFLSPGRGLKALLRRADKLNARYALIIGANEMARGVVQLRNLRESVQREVPRTEVVELLKREISPATR